jgi:hypothetical protein
VFGKEDARAATNGRWGEKGVMWKAGGLRDVGWMAMRENVVRTVYAPTITSFRLISPDIVEWYVLVVGGVGVRGEGD